MHAGVGGLLTVPARRRGPRNGGKKRVIGADNRRAVVLRLLLLVYGSDLFERRVGRAFDVHAVTASPGTARSSRPTRRAILSTSVNSSSRGAPSAGGRRRSIPAAATTCSSSPWSRAPAAAARRRAPCATARRRGTAAPRGCGASRSRCCDPACAQGCRTTRSWPGGPLQRLQYGGSIVVHWELLPSLVFRKRRVVAQASQEALPDREET